jgi:undecaprenyl-diphosphatase
MQAAGRLRRPWLNSLIVPFTISGNNGLLWIVIGVIVADPLRTAVTVWGTLLLNTAIKLTVRRQRPLAQEFKSLVNLPVTTSFPSAHASMSAAAAFALTHAQPELVGLWIGMALLMGASRVYVGAHHASDVLAGFALGGMIGVLSLALPTS